MKHIILANNQERFQVCMEPTAIPKFVWFKGLRCVDGVCGCRCFAIFFLT